MKNVFYLALIGALSICTSSRLQSQNLHFANNKVIAHRGAWKKMGLPENSIASLRRAIDLGCAGSEFDVRMTLDDSLVIHHDPVYQGLEVEKSNFADLEKFTFPNGEKLPTLRQYLKAGIKGNTTTRLVLEIKPSPVSKERGREVVKKVMKLIGDLKAAPWIVIISFDKDMLKEAIALNPHIPTQFLDGSISPEELSKQKITGADYYYSVFINHPDWIASAHQHHVQLNAWTVNDIEHMDWLLANDFDFITTNEPELLLDRSRIAPTSKGWKLVWSDEFNQPGLPDSSNWAYETGGNGWGNHELQYYTQSDSMNAVVKEGMLQIVARKSEVHGNSYSSARLTTMGKHSFKYGLIEIRAKLPAGRGTWPALWMLGDNIKKVGWPKGGEIDIMEHVGYEKDSVRGTVHTEAYNHIKGTQRGGAVFIDDPYDQFHVYGLQWTPEKIIFSMDGHPYYQFDNEHNTIAEWPFSQPFYLIFNLAIGGDWGGKMGVDDTIFPASFLVDYVRVFQRKWK